MAVMLHTIMVSAAKFAKPGGGGGGLWITGVISSVQ